MSLLINKLNNAPEIFLTIQGEGYRTGHPSIFIRLHSCNLSCPWCDSSCTWDKTDPSFEGGIKLDNSVILHRVSTLLAQCPNADIVITGGEPFVQYKQLYYFIQELTLIKGSGQIWIETNASIDVKNPAFKLLDINLSMSPKLELESVGFSLDQHHKFINSMYSAKNTQYYKFVVNGINTTIENVKAFLEEFSYEKPQVVYLMPNGVNEEQLKQSLTYIYSCFKKEQNGIIKTKGNHIFKISDRVHVRIWGNKKGV